MRACGRLGMPACTPLKRFSTRYRAKVRTRVAPPSSAALWAAICGPAASRIAPKPTANSATPILSASTAKAVGGSRPRPNWRTPARTGRGGRGASAPELETAGGAVAGEGGATFVVLPGGEPMLQVDGELIDALHRRGFTIA